jgi:hypothetical protein
MDEGQTDGVERSSSFLGHGVMSQEDPTQSHGSEHQLTPGGRLRHFGGILLEVWGMHGWFSLVTDGAMFEIHTLDTVVSPRRNYHLNRRVKRKESLLYRVGCIRRRRVV